MHRRSFLKWLIAAPAVLATVDVEQLLWTPTPMVTVPAMPTGLSFHRDAFCFVSTDMAVAEYREQWPPSGPYVAMRDPVTGISLRYVQQYEQVTRYDLLAGWTGRAQG
jgi:hypothetical protein